MEAKAIARHIRVTPMKARRVVNLVRGKQANEALAILKFAQQAASEPVYKVVASAMANARVLGTPDANGAQRAEARVDILAALPALRALGLFEVLEIRDPALRAWVEAN